MNEMIYSLNKNEVEMDKKHKEYVIIQKRRKKSFPTL